MQTAKDLESRLIEIVSNDSWMMEILAIVKALSLDDCWIGAGFVRNKVWDELHGKNRTPLNDIDVIYHNTANTSREADLQIESQLKKEKSQLNWSVKNQARMHLKNGHQAYKNCEEAISFWPETATAIAIHLNTENELVCISPHGLEDLFELKVIPTPSFSLATYQSRIESKNWSQIWDKLVIEMAP